MFVDELEPSLGREPSLARIDTRDYHYKKLCMLYVCLCDAVDVPHCIHSHTPTHTHPTGPPPHPHTHTEQQVWNELAD